MKVLKNGEVRNQIHLYTEPKVYNEFKECIKQLKETTGNNYGISEIIRTCIIEFTKSAEFQQKIISNIDGASADNGGVDNG